MHINSLEYLTNRLKDVDILEKGELNSLILRYQQGDIEAGKQVILHNVKYVVQIAQGYVKKYDIEFDAIITYGIIGMYNAMRRFNPNKGAFTTYSRHWIMQSITRMYLWNRDPVNTKEKKRAVRYKFESLDDPERLPCKNVCVSVEVKHEDPFLRDVIREYINNIEDPRTQSIMRYKFDFISGYNDLTLRDIGKIHGLTNERIRQIVESELRKMRYNKKIRKLVGK